MLKFFLERLVKAEKHALFIEEAPQKIAATLGMDHCNDHNDTECSFYLRGIIQTSDLG